MKTYAEAGVDIDRKGVFLNVLLGEIKYRRRDLKQGTPIGHYSSLLQFGEYYLAINTDGVGTKMLIADEVGKWDSVGIDAVAMNVNDTICVGATPFAFVDYLVIRDYDIRKAREIGRSLNEGARQARITIVGGETAVMPDMVNGTDLSGTSVGYVRIGDEITGRKIKNGDVIIGLESSGLHSNGFTLVRKLLKEKNIDYSEKVGNSKLSRILLTPTRIYVSTVLKIIKNTEVHGIAHITGGGLRNLTRLGKKHFVIDDPIKPQRIFNFIMDLGEIDYFEMYQTFNMGMGMALVLPEKNSTEAMKISEGDGINARVVGYVQSGKGVSLPEFKIYYEHY